LIKSNKLQYIETGSGLVEITENTHNSMFVLASCNYYTND